MQSGKTPLGRMVNSCVCFDVSFERIREVAGENENGLLEAHRRTGCGGRCGLCLPYIKAALILQQDSLPVMWTEQFNKLGINPGRIKAIERAIARQQLEMDTERDNRSSAAG